MLLTPLGHDCDCSSRRAPTTGYGSRCQNNDERDEASPSLEFSQASPSRSPSVRVAIANVLKLPTSQSGLHQHVVGGAAWADRHSRQVAVTSGLTVTSARGIGISAPVAETPG